MSYRDGRRARGVRSADAAGPPSHWPSVSDNSDTIAIDDADARRRRNSGILHGCMGDARVCGNPPCNAATGVAATPSLSSLSSPTSLPSLPDGLLYRSSPESLPLLHRLPSTRWLVSCATSGLAPAGEAGVFARRVAATAADDDDDELAEQCGGDVTTSGGTDALAGDVGVRTPSFANAGGDTATGECAGECTSRGMAPRATKSAANCRRSLSPDTAAPSDRRRTMLACAPVDRGRLRGASPAGVDAALRLSASDLRRATLGTPTHA